MTYKSKRIVTSLIVSLVFIIAYCVYAFGRHSPDADNLQSWAIVMLSFIGGAILIQIIIQIFFHIAFSIGIAIKEQDDDCEKINRSLSSVMMEDEMDKLISLKASKVGYLCGGIGFMITLVALALGSSAIIALHAVFASFFIASVIEGSLSIYFYEKGLRNA